MNFNQARFEVKNKPGFYSKTLNILIIFACLILSVAAQNTNEDKSKVKDFGSSLKQNANKKDEKDNKKDVPEEEVLRVETNLVVNDILVFDKRGHPIQGLNKDDFIVTEDNETQDVQVFSLGDRVPIPRTIVLVIDYSASMRPYINKSAEAAKSLVDRLNPNDRMAIITDDVSVLVNFTSDKTLLKRGLDILKARSLLELPSRNLQYSALFATLNEMFNKKDIYPVIIFQTDGDELPYLKDRMFSFQDILNATEKARATIYTIIPSIKLIGLSEKDQIKKMKLEIKNKLGYQVNKNMLKLDTQQSYQQQLALEKIAKFSGGWNDFLETPEQANEVYPRIIAEMNRHYIIGYYPTNEVKDGNQRNVKIEVRGHPEYVIKGRKVYSASESKKID